MAIPSSQVQEQLVVDCLIFYLAEIGLGSDVILTCFMQTASLLFCKAFQLREEDSGVIEVFAKKTLGKGL